MTLHTDTLFTSQQNIIINGNFDFWQRGISFPSMVNGTYYADRFKYGQVGTMVISGGQTTSFPLIANGADIKLSYAWFSNVVTAQASLAAGDLVGFQQEIEGYAIAPYHEKTLTLSFWAYATKTGIYSVSIRDSASSVSYVTEYTINTSNTWEYQEITFPVTTSSGTWNTDNTRGMTVWWSNAIGSTYATSTLNTWTAGNFVASTNQVNGVDTVSNQWRIANVKLVEGTTPNSMIYRDIGQELALCHRYYYNTPDIISANVGAYTSYSATIRTNVFHPQIMRVNPIITLGTASFITGASASTSRVDSFVLVGTANSAGTAASIAGYTADAEL